MLARVYVTFKQGILDPQAVAVSKALASMGHDEVEEVKVGKFFDLDLGTVSADAAPDLVDDMCHKLLSNPVIEQYTYELVANGAPAPGDR